MLLTNIPTDLAELPRLSARMFAVMRPKAGTVRERVCAPTEVDACGARNTVTVACVLLGFSTVRYCWNVTPV